MKGATRFFYQLRAEQKGGGGLKREQPTRLVRNKSPRKRGKQLEVNRIVFGYARSREVPVSGSDGEGWGKNEQSKLVPRRGLKGFQKKKL